MSPHKGVLSSLIGLFVLIVLVNGLANGQTVKATTDEKPVQAVSPVQTGSSVNSEPAANPDSKQKQTSEVAESKSDDIAKSAQPTEPVSAPKPQATPAQCKRMITANVVAMPQPIMLNRLGAAIPDGIIFVLKRDTIQTGNQIQLRPGKRPRPLVLRANVGDCLTINLTNFVPSTKNISSNPQAQNTTTEVSLHVQGMEWVNGAQ